MTGNHHDIAIAADPWEGVMGAQGPPPATREIRVPYADGPGQWFHLAQCEAVLRALWKHNRPALRGAVSRSLGDDEP